MIETHERTGSGTALIARRLWKGAILCLAFFGVTLTLQILSGAYHSEFGGYPDEPAHYVTGLMVRDFIAGMDYRNPAQFAQAYYDHYPKVAFGHWPPFFYVVQAFWMLLFSASRTSTLMGLATLTTVLAWMVSAVVSKHFGRLAGVLAGLLTISVPIVQTYSNEVMAESLLTILSFAAAIFFARYLETGRWQDSALFGLFASLAILTKGSAWDLAIIPPVALLLTRKLRLMTRASFWLPVGIVAAMCGPWQLMTMELAEKGWTGGGHPNAAFTLGALVEFLPILANFLGWTLAPVILIGIGVRVAYPYVKNSVEADWATMFALIVSAWLFNSIVPAGVEQRKVITAIPALILFLFAGGVWLAHRLRFNPAMVCAAGVALFALQGFSIVRETHYGFVEAADFLDSRPDLRGRRILVSSEGDGEGMLISEIAMRQQRPAWQVFRATKTLAKMDWNGEGYKSYVNSPDELLSYVQGAGVGLVVLDTFPGRLMFKHQMMIRNAIQKYPEHFHLTGTFSGNSKGAVQIYKVN